MSFFGVGGTFNSDGAVERSGASEDGPSAVTRQRSHDMESSPKALVHERKMEKQKSHHETKIVEEGEKITDAEEEEARREEEVHVLARKLTQHSTYSEAEANPLEASEDSRLNPNSRHFSAKAWAKSLMHLQSKDPERNPMRTTGVAFRNLNVFGYGAENDYQQTVSSIWLQMGSGLGRVLGGKKRRVDILRNFEGIVHAGEMLVVLGPPGSGCTTFLKTISGETHGFTVDKGSSLNYQGLLHYEPRSNNILTLS